MAYVPKCDADIFVSYAHADDGDPAPGTTRVSWSDLLIGELEREIKKRLGREIGSELTIWQDTKGIRLGDNWRAELGDAIKGAATFLAIISPSYMTSDVCSQERETFLKIFDERDSATALKLLAQSRRYLKLIRLPLDSVFLPDIEHYDFFERNAKGVAAELVPTSDAFRSQVLASATAIKDILQALRRQRERVFVAWPAEDCEADWKSLRADLARQGYDVQPPGRIDDLMSDDQVLDWMKDARLSIHLLGGRYNGGAERQIRLAAKLGLRLYSWLSRDAVLTNDERQAKLVATLRAGMLAQAGALPRGWQIFDSGSLAMLLADALAALKQAEPVRAPSVPGAAPSMYLCCDKTTNGDASFALRLGGEIEERAGFSVLLPPDAPSERRTHHEWALRSCDGVLVFGEAAPREWLGQVVEDVTYAENSYQRPPLRAKALLTPDVAPWTSYPLQMITHKPQFSLADLQLFLDSVRSGPSAPARA